MENTEVKKTREALGLNQPLFAQLMGVHPITVSKWERGATSPTPYQEAFFHQFQIAAKDKEVHDTLKGVLIGAGAVVAILLLLNAAAAKK
jgi:putative transcriptional regulator